MKEDYLDKGPDFILTDHEIKVAISQYLHRTRQHPEGAKGYVIRLSFRVSDNGLIHPYAEVWYSDEASEEA